MYDVFWTSVGPNVTVKGVGKIPQVYIVPVLFCEVLTVQTNGFAVDAVIRVPAVTLAPATYCPIATNPIKPDDIVSIVPFPPPPLLIVPVKLLACIPFLIAIGLPIDPTVWLGNTVQVTPLPDTIYVFRAMPKPDTVWPTW